MRRLSAEGLQMHSMSAMARKADRKETTPEATPDPAEQIRRHRQEAEQEGRREGMLRAQAEAREEFEANLRKTEEALQRKHDDAMRKLESIKASLVGMIDSLGMESERLARMAEETAVEAAYGAVLKLLGDRAAERTLMRDLCLHALGSAEQAPTTLRVSTADFASLGIGEDWKAVNVVVDAGMKPGQCAFDTRLGHYETGLDVRLETLKNAFLEGLQLHRTVAS